MKLVSINDYTEEEELGRGAYGVVSLASIKDRKVAIKNQYTLKRGNINQASVIEAAVVVYMSNHGLNDYIVPIDGIGVSDEHISIIMPAAGMDLANYIKSSKPFSMKYLKQITNGVHFMHSHDMIHRDLKPQNILYYEAEDRMVITDFGMTTTLTCSSDRQLTNEVVTLWYRPPEILLGSKKYSYSADIWSLGCIAYEMETRNALFKGDGNIDQMFIIFRQLGTPNSTSWPGVGQYPKWNSSTPQWKRKPDPFGLLKQTKVFVEKCLKMNPIERTNITDLSVLIGNDNQPAFNCLSNLLSIQAVYHRSMYAKPMHYVITSDWLSSVTREFKISPKAYELACYILGYISKDIETSQYQVYASAALLIGSTMTEMYPPGIIEFTKIGDGAYTAEQLIEASIDLLKRSKCDLIRSTPHDLIGEYCNLFYPKDDQFVKLAKAFGSLSLTSHRPKFNGDAQYYALWAIYNACHYTSIEYVHGNIIEFGEKDVHEFVRDYGMILFRRTSGLDKKQISPTKLSFE